jgi:hypothetical protein
VPQTRGVRTARGAHLEAQVRRHLHQPQTRNHEAGRRRRARCVPDGFPLGRPNCSAARLLSSSGPQRKAVRELHAEAGEGLAGHGGEYPLACVRRAEPAGGHPYRGGPCAAVGSRGELGGRFRRMAARQVSSSVSGGTWTPSPWAITSCWASPVAADASPSGWPSWLLRTLLSAQHIRSTGRRHVAVESSQIWLRASQSWPFAPVGVLSA